LFRVFSEIPEHAEVLVGVRNKVFPNLVFGEFVLVEELEIRG
jgi:hypothetical protein